MCKQIEILNLAVKSISLIETKYHIRFTRRKKAPFFVPVISEQNGTKAILIGQFQDAEKLRKAEQVCDKSESEKIVFKV